MSDIWERKREPDAVPTPTAVAVSDFCRRAKAQAPASEVREALAVLTDDDDFRIRELVDAEPEVTPLGPFAVVDLLQGTSPQLAADRQACGYYGLVRALVEERARKAPLPPAPSLASVPAPAPTRTPASSPVAAVRKTGKQEKERELTVAEKIAPRKRAAADDSAPFAEDDDRPFGKKQLPVPRGRYARVEATRRAARELFDAESRELLEGLVGQHPHRYAILRALANQYSGRAGSLFGMPDVLGALAHHGLSEALERKERDLVIGSYAEHRGAAGRVGWALTLNLSELRNLVEALGLSRQVEELRERFRRESLDARNLQGRLDLIGRSKYLADLGIEKRFTDSLRGELRSKLGEAAADAGSLEELFTVAAKRHGVSAELLGRAADRLRLTDELRKRLGGSSASRAH